MDDIARQYVAPFYLKVLHGNFLRADSEEGARLQADMQTAAQSVTVEIAEELWRRGGWREALMASWWAACWRWPITVERVEPLLIPSRTCFAGQAHCVALASIGSPDAVDALDRYLAFYLPLHDLHYDQAWAMAALTLADAERAAAHQAAWSLRSAATRVDGDGYRRLAIDVAALREYAQALAAG